MGQMWSWEIEAVAAIAAKLNELERLIVELGEKHALSLTLGDIDLEAEGERVGVFSYTDLGDWGYESTGPKP